MSTSKIRGSKAMLFEDYIRYRDAKIGEEVTLSDGTVMVRKSMVETVPSHSSKNMNLDFYDGTYVG